MTPNQRIQAARAFYEMAFNDCEPAKAARLYCGDTYIQHNPHVGDGIASFVAYFERMAEEWPGKTVSVKRSYAADDVVVLHCHQVWPGDHEYAGIDIFRFDENDKIVEHWDVLQVIPATSKNGNGMF